MVDTYFNNYIIQYYIDCASTNCIVNDRRSAQNHKTFTFLIGASIALLATFMLVNILDKNTKSALNHLISQCLPTITSTNNHQSQDPLKEGASNDKRTVPETAATAKEASEGGARATSTQESTKTNGEIEDGRQGKAQNPSTASSATTNPSGKGGHGAPETVNKNGEAEKEVNSK